MPLPSFVREGEARKAAERAAQEQQARDARKQEERRAHQAAVDEAGRKLKESGASGGTVRTRYSSDAATSEVTKAYGGRSSQRSQRQYSQSGEPVQITGDSQAIQQLRAEAFQRAQQKAQRQGSDVDQSAINRETRNIIAERGGSYATRERISNEDLRNRYESLKPLRRESIAGESDMATLSPMGGLRGRGVAEGYTESGRDVVVAGKQNVKQDQYVYFAPDPTNPHRIEQIGSAPGSKVSVNDAFGFTREFKMSTSGDIVGRDITKRPEKQERIGLSDKPAVVFTDTFENFGRQVYSIGGWFSEDIRKDVGRQDYWKPEVGMSFATDIFDFGEKRVTGYDISGRTQRAQRYGLLAEPQGKDLFGTVSGFGTKLSREKPESIAASLAGSALLTLPDLFLKGVKAVPLFAKTKVAPVVAKTTSAGFADVGPFRVYGSPGKLADDVDLWVNYGGRPEEKAFRRIQASRSESSIYKAWPNYEKGPELRGIAKDFDVEPAVKSGAISIDELSVTKEFERAPLGRFMTEKRPKVVGEKISQPLTIDEELGLVKMNPSKPVRPGTRTMPTLGELRTDTRDIPTPWKQTKFFREGTGSLGDPMTEQYNYLKKPDVDFLKKPSTDWIFKSEGAPVASTSEFKRPLTEDMFRSSLAKPESTDWIFRSEGAPFSFVGSRKGFNVPLAPIEPRRPLTEDMFRSSLFKESPARLAEGAPFKLESPKNLPTYGELFPDLFKSRKPKGNRPLSEKEGSDLIKTLEGREQVPFERDFLSREEQGKSAAEFTEEFFKPVKGKSKSLAEKAAEDFLRQFKAEQKAKESASLIQVPKEKAASQASVLVGRPETKRRPRGIEAMRSDMLPEPVPRPKNEKFPSWSYGTKDSGKLESMFSVGSATKERGSDRMIRDNIRSLSGARTGGKSVFDFGNMGKLDLGVKPFSAGKFDDLTGFKFKPMGLGDTKLGIGEAIITDSFTGQTTEPTFAFDLTIPTPTEPTPGIPTLDTPWPKIPTVDIPTFIPPKFPGGGGLAFGGDETPKRRSRRRIRRVKPTAYVPDTFASVIGVDTKWGKAMDKFANPEFFGKRGRKRRKG